jgi:ABC-type sugar transport system ATPase subunit
MINDVRDKGVAVIYITHKMDEVARIADRITVLRDGRHIATTPAGDMPPDALIRHMVGRDIDPSAGRSGHEPPTDAPVRLAVEDFTVRSTDRARPPVVDGVSLEVRGGRILGLAGLQGSGNSDLLLGLFGALGRRASGQVRIDGQPVRIRTVRDAIGAGVAMVTNDRQRSGLVPGMDVTANVTLATLPRVSPGGWIRHGREVRVATELTRTLELRARSLRQPVNTLSGGNQQKVVLAKWLSLRPRVLLLDEPTRGVDVGAKHEIYQLMNRWSADGHAIILITSELPELLMMSDSLAVMHRGRVTARFERSEATPERVLQAAMGG